MKDLIGGLFGLALLLVMMGVVVGVALWAFANLGTLLLVLAAIFAVILLLAVIMWAYENISDLIAEGSGYAVIGYVCLPVFPILSGIGLFTDNTNYIMIGVVFLVVANLAFRADSTSAD